MHVVYIYIMYAQCVSECMYVYYNKCPTFLCSICISM